MAAFSRELAHDIDAAWIIALWKAIHGGDPAPNFTVGEGTDLQALALATQLAERNEDASASPEQVIKALAGFGITIRMAGNDDRELSVESLATVTEPERPKQICVFVPEIKGPVYCHSVLHRVSA